MPIEWRQSRVSLLRKTQQRKRRAGRSGPQSLFKRVMTRQFLAFLALLSGLAALQAPAHAQPLASHASDVQVPALSKKVQTPGVFYCRAAMPPAVNDPLYRANSELRPGRFASAAPAIIFGVDRAHE